MQDFKVFCFSYKPIIEYVDEQFERYLHDESGLNRRHIIDNRVHCCFYFVSPTGHGYVAKCVWYRVDLFHLLWRIATHFLFHRRLKPLDIEFMKALHHKVNIVPVISKADTLTLSEVKRLKKRILEEIAENNIQIYCLPDADDDEDEDFKEQTRNLKVCCCHFLTLICLNLRYFF